MDSQTRVEHTLAIAALVQAMVKELARALRRGQVSCPATRTRCSTRTSGSPPATGSRASWWTCRRPIACRPLELARRLMDRLRPHAEELGSADDFDCLEDILDNGNGAARQALGLRGQPRSARGGARNRRGQRARGGRDPRRLTHPGGYSERHVSQPDLFVVCQQLRVGGQPVRNRVPVLRAAGPQAGAEDRSLAAASPSPSSAAGAAPTLAAAAGGGDRRHRARHRGPTRRSG